MNRLLGVLVMCVAMAASAEEAGGLTWTAPTEWAAQGERPMRAATYKVPAAKGDTEGAELAVFYFGQGQGGAVDANVKRWLGQFQTADGKPVDKAAKTKAEKLGGLPVTTVDVKGTYTGGGPMMGPSTPKPGYRLLGAIVEGPEGAVFFKLTGPEKTVAASEKSFRKLLESVKKK
ncbi:hypothetical protein LZ198_40590 [Myxococcus sp. K15C18031901]|uniref:hypothetical protein n=1 Tax=Myxococcus dinghuensis TaxID=2906761 RepID=UPI0020A6DD13|nr:hypothetical protein [Myxococcus dinghuensis]MCP3105186.1 hypothetical protein [Myxococcus dinghuensis]